LDSFTASSLPAPAYPEAVLAVNHMAKRLIDGQRRLMREFMLRHEPNHILWLNLELTSEEREQAVKRALYLWEELRPKNPWGLVWCLAIDRVRPRKRGNKPKWSGDEGEHFELEVDFRRMYVEDQGKKESISDSIRAVMLGSREHYGLVNDSTVETMRQNYYKIRRSIFGPENKRKKGTVSVIKPKRSSPK
jgi:hypothetical protein